MADVGFNTLHVLRLTYNHTVFEKWPYFFAVNFFHLNIPKTTMKLMLDYLSIKIRLIRNLIKTK